MLRDPDPQVIINVLHSLNEILSVTIKFGLVTFILLINIIIQDEGGIALNQKIVFHLLKQMKYLNEWNQAIILELITDKFHPDQPTVISILVGSVINKMVILSNADLTESRIFWMSDLSLITVLSHWQL